MKIFLSFCSILFWFLFVCLCVCVCVSVFEFSSTEDIKTNCSNVELSVTMEDSMKNITTENIVFHLYRRYAFGLQIPAGA